MSEVLRKTYAYQIGDLALSTDASGSYEEWAARVGRAMLDYFKDFYPEGPDV